MKKQQTAESAAKKEAVALELASGKSIVQAARTCGVGERTVHGWIVNDPTFRQLVATLRSRLTDEAVGRLSALAVYAVAVLGASLKSDNEGIKIRAASAILDHLISMRSHVEVEQRLADIERSVADGDIGSVAVA